MDFFSEFFNFVLVMATTSTPTGSETQIPSASDTYVSQEAFERANKHLRDRMSPEEITRIIREMGISRAQLLSDRNARHCAAENCAFWALHRSTMSSHFNRTHVKKPEEIERRLMAHKVNMGLMKFVDKNLPHLKNKMHQVAGKLKQFKDFKKYCY